MYLIKLYFLLSSYFQKLGFSHQAKKNDNVVTTGNFYTMPHSLKVEGRETPLFLLMHYMKRRNPLSSQVFNNVLHNPYKITGRINSQMMALTLTSLNTL